MIDRQIAAVREELQERPTGLVGHVERVLAEAVPLARVWQVDEARIELAVWGHDLFRSESPEEQLRLGREAGVDIDPDAAAYPILLHGPIAAAVLRERFGVTDNEALAAVRDHTAGLDEMSLLAKILLIADKVEPNKRRRAPALGAGAGTRAPRSRHRDPLLGRPALGRRGGPGVSHAGGPLAGAHGVGARSPQRAGDAGAGPG